ncbi:MAG TPA: FAD-dependent oxidoreductase [Anaerolineae bacterium]|nr:FAD-dependent oxidoreductase [Anaerolineae bacterium]HPL28458.1 FAD-dependent oxidoreductase [Anaerolineae bacterium]
MSRVIFCSWDNQVVDNRGKGAGATPVPVLEGLDEFEPGNKILALVGWNGAIIYDERVDVVDMARAYLDVVQGESCGKCTPCRMGTRVVADTLARIAVGRGVEEDLPTIRRLAEFVRAGSMCELGHTSMTALLHLLDHYEAEFCRAIAEGRRRLRGHYHTKVTAPCIEACPERLDVPRYIEYIKSGRYAQSLSVIRQKNPLSAVCGRVCVRFCEFQCRRGLLDDPVSIKHLKRFVSDVQIEGAVRHEPPPSARRNGHRVAIIGAGPSGLTAAYRLARKGYAVEILEAMGEPGGMAAMGIPDYRLPREVLRTEVEEIERLGAKIHYGRRLGRDFDLQSLRQEGFAAVYVAIGAQNSHALGVPGESAQVAGYVPGIEFLRRLNLGEDPAVGQRAVVVGGGNVAIDCARSALRLGLKDVTLVYRRGREEMPADRVEVHDAEAEGIRFELLSNPTRIIEHEGRVVGVACVRMALGEPDASGRRQPRPVAGSEFIIETDMVIPAIGQVVDLSFLKERNYLETTRRGTIKADPDTLETSEEGVFAGGDCVSGPRTLIEAMAAGLRAANSIDQYLREGKVTLSEDERMSRVLKAIHAFDNESVDRLGGRHRVQPRERPTAERVDDFDEVEQGITPEEALMEADRCLRCYRIMLVATER